eukprot:361794-Chlamydomonas_euryale.AAC.4
MANSVRPVARSCVQLGTQHAYCMHSSRIILMHACIQTGMHACMHACVASAFSSEATDAKHATMLCADVTQVSSGGKSLLFPPVTSFPSLTLPLPHTRMPHLHCEGLYAP